MALAVMLGACGVKNEKDCSIDSLKNLSICNIFGNIKWFSSDKEKEEINDTDTESKTENNNSLEEVLVGIKSNNCNNLDRYWSEWKEWKDKYKNENDSKGIKIKKYDKIYKKYKEGDEHPSVIDIKDYKCPYRYCCKYHLWYKGKRYDDYSMYKIKNFGDFRKVITKYIIEKIEKEKLRKEFYAGLYKMIPIYNVNKKYDIKEYMDKIDKIVSLSCD